MDDWGEIMKQTKRQVQDTLALTLVTVWVMLGISQGFAQAISTIERSPRYVSGLGEAETLEAARQQALHELTSGIQMTVNTVFERHVQETGRSFQDSTRMVQSVSSAIQLRNVRERVEQTDRGYRVLKYIERSQLQRFMDDMGREILDHLHLSKQAAAEMDMTDALWHAYAAYLLSRVYADTLSLPELAGTPTLANPELAIHTYLDHLLQSIHLEVEHLEVEDDMLLVYLSATVEQHPVKRLSLSYYNGQTTEYLFVEQGSATLEYLNPLTDKEKILQVTLAVRQRDALAADSFLEQLDQKQFLAGLALDRALLLDVASLMIIDFEIALDDRTVECVPTLQLIRPEAVQWDFGDGTRSSRMQPVHRYDELATFVITLMLNNDESLKVQKQVDLHTGTVTKPERNSKPMVVMQPEPDPVGRQKETGMALVPDSAMIRLAEITHTAKALAILQQKQRRGLWIIGRRNDFHTPENKYVLICDDHQVIDVLWMRNQKFVQVATGNPVPDLHAFRGKRTIWIETIQD